MLLNNKFEHGKYAINAKPVTSLYLTQTDVLFLCAGLESAIQMRIGRTHNHQELYNLFDIEKLDYKLQTQADIKPNGDSYWVNLRGLANLMSCGFYSYVNLSPYFVQQHDNNLLNRGQKLVDRIRKTFLVLNPDMNMNKRIIAEDKYFINSSEI